MHDINGMYMFREMYAKAIAVYRTKDKIIHEELMALEEEMDKAECSSSHISTRMFKNQNLLSSFLSTVIFLVH